MSCFWKGILAAITPIVPDVKRSPSSLIEWFQTKASKIDCVQIQQSVYWQNFPLSIRLLEENRDWILRYESKRANSGHLTSTCDPFLIVLCYVLNVDIDHLYLSSKIEYRNISKTKSKWRLIFRSNSGHFSFVKRQSI